MPNDQACLERVIRGAEIAAEAIQRPMCREIHQADMRALLAGYSAAVHLLAPFLAKEMINASSTDGNSSDSSNAG